MDCPESLLIFHGVSGFQILGALFFGTVGGTRTLLDRRVLVTPRSYRRAVRRFEDDMLKTWFVEDPSVITLDQWKEYDARATNDDAHGPSTPAQGLNTP